MHGMCKHYTALCCCTICWRFQAQCFDADLHRDSVEQQLLRGEGHITEEENFEDYVSNHDFITMDQSIEGSQQVGNICNSPKQSNNTTSKEVHITGKSNVLGHKRKITVTDKYVQSENKRRDFPKYINNTEYRLHNNDLSRTDGGRCISGDGSELLCTDDDGIIRNEFGETNTIDITSPPTSPEPSVPSLDNSHEAQTTPTFIFILH